MKNTKKILSIFLALLMIFSIIPMTSIEAEAATYNASAAISFANSHWNDGVGLCAEFVSRCLNAGGITIPNRAYYSSSTQSYNNNSGTLGAYTNPYTCSASLLLYLSEGYPIITNPSSSDIEVGDVVFMYGGSSGQWKDGHVGIVISKTNGVPVYAAHNKATNSGKFSSSYPCTYVAKMNGEIVPHTHSYSTTEWEAAHPHKIYVKCSCGDWYYTEDNKILTSCSSCWTATWTLSQRSISVKVGESQTIGVTISGVWPESKDWVVEWEEDLFDISSGTQQITVTGKKVGTGSIRMYIYSDSSRNVLIGSQTIPVTVSSNTYTLSYNDGAGEGAPSSQSGSTSYTISSTVPTRFGYTFIGWSTNFATWATVEYEPGDIITLTADKTLYAVWKSAGEISAEQFRQPYIDFANQEYYYSFTPSTSGKYVIQSDGNVDAMVYVYDSNGNLLGEDDDDGYYNGLGLRDFYLSINLTAGTKYYIKVRAHSTTTGSIIFSISEMDTYTVSYNANGGTGAPSSQIKTDGETLTLSSTVPTRTGYTFLGWSTSSSATSATYSAGGNFTSNANTTLYAVWKANTYTVKYNANGGSGSMSNSSHTYDVSKSLTSNAFTRTGYTFLGWSTSSSATSATYTNGQSVKNLTSTNNGTVNLYAVWSKNPTYTLSYNANGGTGAPSSQTGSTSYTISNTVPVRSGYTFLGWSKSSSATSASYQPGDYITISSNTILYAVWKADTSSLVVNSLYNATISSGGEMKYYTFTPSVSGKYVIYSTSNEDTKVYLYNSSGTQLATDDDSGDGNNFRLEYDLTAGTTYCYGIIYLYSSKTGTIPFAFGRVYTVSYSANGGTGAPSSQNKDYGATLTLSNDVPTRTGYTFLGWSTSASVTSATYSAGGSFTTNTNTTLYAVWKANTYTVKYNANGGTGTMSNSSHTYDVSKSLSSNVFTRSGYTFLGWSISASATSATYTNGQSVKNLTATNGDTVNLYAVWSKNPTYTLSYNANGGTGAPSSQTGSTSYTISNTKPTRTGYTFLGWSTNNSATSATYEPGDTITLSSNTTLYAVWTTDSSTLVANSTYSATISNGGEEKYYTFTPSSSGKYVIYSTSSEDTKVYLYNSSGTQLDSDDDSSEGNNFRLEYNLTAGTTYRFGVRYYNSSKTGTIPFTFGHVYTVSYNANDGIDAPSSQSKDYGATLILSSTVPTRTGYTFLGWSTSSTATSATYSAGGTFTSNANTTLYAVWKANESSEPSNSYGFEIQQPSRTTIRHKDGIILHANVEGNAPAGSYVRWESNNGNFDKSADGSNLKIIAKNKGYTTFTAILCDADGNELARDSVEMYSKSGFFDKIGGFFRDLFGTTKIYDK